jgi:hypothetical protein
MKWPTLRKLLESQRKNSEKGENTENKMQLQQEEQRRKRKIENQIHQEMLKHKKKVPIEHLIIATKTRGKEQKI